MTTTPIGISVAEVAIAVGVPVAEARKVRSAWRRAWPAAAEWVKKLRRRKGARR